MDTYYTLITGASAGIGAALAREYARRGRPLVLLARRRERLESLAAELRSQVPVEILTADLADPTAPARIVEELGARGLAIEGLVNNAGYGLPGAYHVQDWAAHVRFLQVMVTAVCELSWRLLPPMQARGHGEILNIASLAGHVPGSAGHTLYAASKAFMIKFSESLALENAERGIRVCALCPGFTYSEFHDVTGTRERMSQMPGFMWMTAEEVARQGYAAVERGEVVHVTGGINRGIARLAKLVPDRVALGLMARGSHRFRSEE